MLRRRCRRRAARGLLKPSDVELAIPCTPHVRQEIVCPEGDRLIHVQGAEAAQKAGPQRADHPFWEAVGLALVLRPPEGVALGGQYV